MLDTPRIDTSELKNLLRKHKQTFSDDEIIQIGEMFYAGQSGGSVPIEQFIEALDKMMVDAGQDTNPLELGTCGNEYLFFNSHSNHTKEELKGIQITHTEPQSIRDLFALQCVKGVRFVFDTATGWNTEGKPITPDMVLNRTIFLETIAAVPGMVAAIIRHFRSLRTMQRDGGMLQMFLDEANNERMHLLTFVRMKNPGTLFRAAVIGGQFGFGALFGEQRCNHKGTKIHVLTIYLLVTVGLSYIVAPKFCHRFVGYIEEEAVMTYTKIIDVIEDAPEGSDMGKWKKEIAPRIARSYWKLGQDGTVLDVMYAVRADEAEHRDVNHMCSELKDGDPNPVCNTSQQLNTMMVKYMKDMMERDVNAPLQTQVTAGSTTSAT